MNQNNFKPNESEKKSEPSAEIKSSAKTENKSGVESQNQSQTDQKHQQSRNQQGQRPQRNQQNYNNNHNQNNNNQPRRNHPNQQQNGNRSQAANRPNNQSKNRNQPQNNNPQNNNRPNRQSQNQNYQGNSQQNNYQNNNRNFNNSQNGHRHPQTNNHPNNQSRNRNNHNNQRGHLPPSRMTPSKITERYDLLLEDHIKARRNYFYYFYSTDEKLRTKCHEQFDKTLLELRNFESSLRESWQQEALSRRSNPYPLDLDHSTKHQLPQIEEKVDPKIQFEDIHFASVTKINFKDDQEESLGSIEDYLQYKNSKGTLPKKKGKVRE